MEFPSEIENRSRKRNHKLDGIGGKQKFPFLSNSINDYDPV